MSAQMRRPISWRQKYRAYGWWVVSAFMIWLLTYLVSLELSIRISYQMANVSLEVVTPILQAIVAWVVFRTVIPDRRHLAWLIAVTLLGYALAFFVRRYIYALVYPLMYRLLHLPTHTLQQMTIMLTITSLITLVTVAVLQALFLGPILKRVNRGFVLAWIVAAMIAAVVSSICLVWVEDKYYSPSDTYTLLVQSIVTGIVTGLPLLWLKTR